MSKNKKYYPDYHKLYPGVEISPEVLAELRKSDRKMKYMEYELKTEQPVKDENGTVIALLPGREDSLERLMEAGMQYVAVAPSPEQIVLEQEEIEELHGCLALLSEDERELIYALFVDKLTQREYGKKIGLSQKNVSKHRRRILQKLRELLDS